MSLKKYGIYLAYPPSVDLRAEGLGRYLANFIKGASFSPDITFVILCPEWSRRSLQLLFEDENVPNQNYTFLHPSKTSFLVKIFFFGKKLNKNKKAKKFNFGFEKIRTVYTQFIICIERNLARTSSIILFLAFFLPLYTITIFIGLLFSLPYKIGKVILKRLSKMAGQSAFFRKLAHLAKTPKSSSFILRLFPHMMKSEEDALVKLANRAKVHAWYSPTAFWPSFNNINAPGLMCVPDVVLHDFPVGFSKTTDSRSVTMLNDVITAIDGAKNCVTYSENVKWETLVKNHGKNPKNVSVIHHAPSFLDEYVTVSNTIDDAQTSTAFCQKQLKSAFLKSDSSYGKSYGNMDVKFLFYASQVRPNKNILTLLRAYKYLLRERDFSHKLILTGNLYASPELKSYILENKLQQDIIVLKKLSVVELAACYKLADLAVNPSLSEGGCPFTFTEALSVGTPVIMAKIQVAEEILTDPSLQELTFFDPYSWHDLATHIESALANREQLLQVQSCAYQELSLRTWQDVTREHVDALNTIAEQD